jgi:carboxyl-terminal processing protease
MNCALCQAHIPPGDRGLTADELRRTAVERGRAIDPLLARADADRPDWIACSACADQLLDDARPSVPQAPAPPPAPASALMRVWLPLLAVLVAFSAAFTITFVWPKSNGLNIDIDASPRARAAQNREPYDLTQLRVLNRAILEVKDHYVEPERIRPQRMLLAGLNAIQRSVPPVLVHYEEGDPELTVQVNTESRSFRVDDVNSPWALANRFRDIFRFLQDNLEDEDIELQEVEYAAVNGMLRTLDPHTVLLTPDVFEEMQMSTRGEFGGLGIVISLREGHLTIIRPMPNTPASRAGLRRWDRIVKINEESTLNMPLSEAVDRLRGPPGSRVAVWVRHRQANGSYASERRYDLVRAVIHIESVQHRMLADGIGYVRIENFQGNTYEDMRRSLAELHRENMRGLILDLRGNPGGLLEQAVRIADAFLTSGTIVTTSSNDPSQRDEKFARREGTEPNYPMIVLVNGQSASASEIVAGALKNHDRALIVGERTFGKGSVQVLYNFQDGSALKLTIAQYLTPGDVSIQGVGIVPDIAIDPMTVDREDMDLTVDRDYLREADLRSHLTHASARETQQPSVVLRYYLPPDVRQMLLESSPDEREENEEENEFLTRFSQQLLARATRTSRRDLLEEARGVIAQARNDEMSRAVAELRRLGVDWSEGTDQGESAVDVRVSTSRPDNTVTAGEPFELRVRVTNRGTAPLFQLRGTTRSDFRLFDEREVIFGRLNPGETREWATTLGICATEGETDRRVCRVPRDTPDRADGLRVEFDEAHGHAPAPVELRTVVRAMNRPQFAYSLQTADTGGNGDGRVQLGESVTMYLRVKNVGRGRTYDAQANLRNLTGRGVLLHAGRFDLDDMAPGEERTVEFTFQVLQDFDRDEAKLEVSIVDIDLRESITEKVLVPVVDAGGTPSPRSGQVTLRGGAVIRQSPGSEAGAVARADGAITLPSTATLDDHVRVDLGGGRPGWVAESDLAGAVGGGRLAFVLDHMPPRLDVDYGNTLVTQADTLTVRGRATDDQQVRDLYIYVGARKVFYQSNGNGHNRREAAFDARIPLTGGINYITVFARERGDVLSRRTFVVRRDAADGSLMETPRFDDDIFGFELEDEEM